MLTLDQKMQAFFATRTENYLASMRLEGIEVAELVKTIGSESVPTSTNRSIVSAEEKDVIDADLQKN